MTSSSVDDLSGANRSGPDEPQKQVQPEIQHPSTANGNFQPGMATPSAEYTMLDSHLEVGQSVAPTAYPYINPFYGGIIATYAGQPAIHPHLMGVLQPGMPLPTDAVVEPVFVNAKQYHGILRRRQSRAKAESENKLIKCRKPYLHESRHLHALKRARGCGGRFFNSKSEGDQQKGGVPSHDKARQSENASHDDNDGEGETREVGSS